MKKCSMKRNIAAVLCTAAVCGSLPISTIAEELAAEQEGNLLIAVSLEQETDKQKKKLESVLKLEKQAEKAIKKAEKEEKKTEKDEKHEAEEALKKAEEEKRRAEEEEKRKAEEALKKAEEEKRKAEEEEKRRIEEALKKAEEEKRKAEEEEKRRIEEALKKAEEEKRKAEEEEKHRIEEALKKAEEERRKAEEEEKRKAEEALKKAEEDASGKQNDLQNSHGIATADIPTILPSFEEIAAPSDGITAATAFAEDCTAADADDGRISGIVSFYGTRDAVILVFDDKGNQAGKVFIKANENGDTVSNDFVIKNLPVGTYTVRFYLKGDIDQNIHPEPRETATVNIAVSKAVAQIKASAAGGKNRIDVTVTEGDSKPIKVMLMMGSEVKDTRIIAADSRKASFEGLAAGMYRVIVDYETQQDSNPVLIENIEVTNARAAIAIDSVTVGEKTLTVKGTAQPGFTIQVETVPATQKAAMVVSDKGSFEWVLAAEPAEYTKVVVFYANDTGSAAVKEGKWLVKAPMTAPTITVDPIDNHSTTVVVKTGAKLAVTLKTPDSTQTVESNAEGLAHFSLTHKYLKGEEFIITVVYGPGSGQTVSQKVTVGGVAEYNDLEYGDYGEAVLRLTTRLHALGYPVSPTKDYNSAVREAVRLFQIANGQEADGEAGDRMQAALYSVSAIPYGSGRYPTLVRGDKGLALIRTLQQRLKDLGYYTIKVDGIFGSGTQRAVRLFQQVNGLRETGIADNATQVLLYSSAAKPLGYGATGEYKTLQRSSKYKSAVVPLQRRLRELGYYSGSIDGYFGSKTYRAVRNFQSRNGLKVNGIADGLTQQVMYSAAAKKYNGSSAGSSSSLGYRLLYWGCRGEEVRRLQNALINAGYKKFVRAADGIFGQWTYDAVRAYQKDHSLSVDGIAGKKTQNLLYGTSY